MTSTVFGYAYDIVHFIKSNPADKVRPPRYDIPDSDPAHIFTKEHYIIELKAGGDLDNKKAKSEKMELLKEYFILKNELVGTDETVKIFFATAYNKNGEDNEWKQERVKQFFAEDELLIGKKYWNFVCDDEEGFHIIYDQYKISCQHILASLEKIKSLYF